jgi:hypothetical protein
MLYRIAFDEADDAEHGEDEIGKIFERRLSTEMLRRRPRGRRAARRLTMDVSDPIPKKARKKNNTTH